MPMHEIVRQRILSYVKEHGTEEIKSTAEIKIITTDAGISPADYCYNRINRGVMDNSNFAKLFIYIKHGVYQIVGENYPYTGDVVWHEKKGSEKVVGKYIDGQFYPTK